MKKMLILATLLAACGNDQPQQPTGQYVLEMCGPAPTSPGVAAAFDGDTVTMSRSTYLALDKFREDVAVWRDCVADLD